MNIGGRDMRIDGGLVRIARLKAERYETVDDPEQILAALRASRARIDLFTFLQKLPETSPKFSYPLEWDNAAVLEVTTFDDWWARQINDKTRNMVRLAEKTGVVLREVALDDALVRGISAIYNETPARQGRRFPHYGKPVGALRAEIGTFLSRAVFIGAFLGEELIGFAKLVCDPERTHAGLMQILSMLKHRDKAPTNALIAQAVRSCASRDVRCLLYASFTYGRKRGDGLSAFKKHNGFRQLNVPRYYVPLSPVGRIAFRLGLHHPLVRHIPEPLLARLRQARSRWYGRRPSPAKG